MSLATSALQEGGFELEDWCHVQLYQHAQVRQKADFNHFTLNDEFDQNVPLYYVAATEKQQTGHKDEDGFLRMLIKEVVGNGFEAALCFSGSEEKKDDEEYPVMMIVAEKLQCRSHRRMGSPLDKGEILALLLYTAGDCNYELCKAQRSGDYATWKWFDRAVFDQVAAKNCRLRLFQDVCEHLVDEGHRSVLHGRNGMLFEIDGRFRERAVCCDISWIFKFGQSECEVLIARSIDAMLNRLQCKAVDERSDSMDTPSTSRRQPLVVWMNQTQTQSLSSCRWSESLTLR